MNSALSTLNTMTEGSLSKAPNPQLLPGRSSINGCPLLRVCACVRSRKCRPQIPSMGHHTWPYVPSRIRYNLVIKYDKNLVKLFQNKFILIMSDNFDGKVQYVMN